MIASLFDCFGFDFFEFNHIIIIARIDYLLQLIHHIEQLLIVLSLIVLSLTIL